MAIAATGSPVQLHLTTLVTQEGQSQSFEFHEAGTLLRMGRAMYLRYTEHGEDGSETPVTFKMSVGGEIQLTRHTQNDVRLRFASGSRIPTRYATPAGSMQLDVHTKNMIARYNDVPFTGNIAIDYALYNGEMRVGDYEIRLTFAEI